MFVVSTSFVEVLPDGVVLLSQSLRDSLERLRLSWRVNRVVFLSGFLIFVVMSGVRVGLL